jgi:hypothetical protein
MRWTIKLVTEAGSEQATEETLLHLERREDLVIEELGLTLAESRRLLEALQRSVVVAQAKAYGALEQSCCHCGRVLHTKGYYRRAFRSAFGRVPVRIRRLLGCSCRSESHLSFPNLPTSPDGFIAPEWVYLQAKFASLIPYARVSGLLSEVLPSGARTRGEAIRRRLTRVGQRLSQERYRRNCEQPQGHEPAAVRPHLKLSQRAAVETRMGLDGGYVRNRHPRPQRHFEVVAGRARGPSGAGRCFAFLRDRSGLCKGCVEEAVAGAGGDPGYLTLLTDGDKGLRALAAEANPRDLVLDWFHLAMRFQVLSQTAKGAPQDLSRSGPSIGARLESAKWHLWHGHPLRSMELLEELFELLRSAPDDDVITKLLNGVADLHTLLVLNNDSLPNYRYRRKCGLAISTGPTESAVNQVVSRRMVKKQQMRWTRDGAQHVLEVRTEVLNETLENTFRRWYPAFRPAAQGEIQGRPHNL